MDPLRLTPQILIDPSDTHRPLRLTPQILMDPSDTHRPLRLTPQILIDPSDTHRPLSRNVINLRKYFLCTKKTKITALFNDFFSKRDRSRLGRVRKHQKYLNLCSEDERRSYGFVMSRAGYRVRYFRHRPNCLDATEYRKTSCRSVPDFDT